MTRSQRIAAILFSVVAVVVSTTIERDAGSAIVNMFLLMSICSWTLASFLSLDADLSSSTHQNRDYRMVLRASLAPPIGLV